MFVKIVIIFFLKTVLSDKSVARNFNSVCGDVFTQQEFLFQSPNYPQNYPNNLECSYLIKGPKCRTNFLFEFLDFDVPSSRGCTQDRLEIDKLDVFCGRKSKAHKFFQSETGTLQIKFVTNSIEAGRGFSIRVTRMSCGKNSTERVNRENFSKQCCNNLNNGKSNRFLMTSPNFPYSLSTTTDCLIQIQKSNENICRLRIHFQFFCLNIFSANGNCVDEYLEIDGKKICGCQKELQLISSFGHTTMKTFRFVSSGNLRNSYAGFVMEVIQDECPNKYSPLQDRYLNDEKNRIIWPNDTQESLTEKLELIKEDTDIIHDTNTTNQNILRHVYYFAPNYFDVPPDLDDREKTTYIDTSSMKSNLGNFHPINECILWNRFQLNLLLTKTVPKCISNQNSVVHHNCVDLHHLRGYFRSPYYPLYYPGNLNVCYRFRKLPGYCAIKIHIQDFHIENSIDCSKDYFLVNNGGQKYCGSSLHNTFATLDLRQKDYEEFTFVTDAYICGRGFTGIFEQIPCQDPINPVTPATTEIIPTTWRSPTHIPCNRIIREERFTITVPKNSEQECVFTIQKTNSLICKVSLYFEEFSLPCTFESLLIDDMTYCGYQKGRTVMIDFVNNEEKLITFKRQSFEGQSFEILIRGIQLDTNCPYPEVPAQLVQRRIDDNNTNFLVSMKNENFEDICGIIKNSTDQNLPKTFCEFVMENNLTTTCISVNETVVTDVPFNLTKLAFNITKLENKLEKIEFHEIDCDNFDKFNQI